MKVQLLDLNNKDCGIVTVSSENPPGAIIYQNRVFTLDGWDSDKQDFAYFSETFAHVADKLECGS